MTAASVPAQSDPVPFRELLAAEVRAHLARQRLSNRKFARMLGLQPTWIDRRLNGTTPMTADDIELFANALHLTPEQLMIGAFQPRPGFPRGIGTRVDTPEYVPAHRPGRPPLSLVPAPQSGYRDDDPMYGSCPPASGYDGSPSADVSSGTVNNADAA